MSKKEDEWMNKQKNVNYCGMEIFEKKKETLDTKARHQRVKKQGKRDWQLIYSLKCQKSHIEQVVLFIRKLNYHILAQVKLLLWILCL